MLTLSVLAGCIAPPPGPARDWLEAPRPPDAAFPALLVQPDLIAALAPVTQTAPADPLAARAAALRARAADLSAQVLSEEERRALNRDIAPVAADG